MIQLLETIKYLREQQELPLVYNLHLHLQKANVCLALFALAISCSLLPGLVEFLATTQFNFFVVTHSQVDSLFWTLYH